MTGTVSGVGTPRHRLTDMELDFVSLVPAGDNPDARVVIAKSAGTNGDDGSPQKEEAMLEPISKSDLPDQVVEYIEALEAAFEDQAAKIEAHAAEITKKDGEIADLQSTLAKSAPKDAQSAEEIRKEALAKADPALRALIEKQDAELAETRAIAKAERDARLTREYISKAEALPMLAEDKTKLAELLRSMAEKLTEEETAAVEKILKDANVLIAKSNLFNPIGTDLGGADLVTTDVRAKAEAIRKADPTMSIEQAEAKVYEENPALLEQALSEESN